MAGQGVVKPSPLVIERTASALFVGGIVKTAVSPPAYPSPRIQVGTNAV